MAAVFILGFIVFFGILVAVTVGNGQSMQLKMRELGDVTQHSFDDIVAKLGPPNAIASMPGGNRLAQWMARGYHIAMTFTADGACLGIDSEVAV